MITCPPVQIWIAPSCIILFTMVDANFFSITDGGAVDGWLKIVVAVISCEARD
jgi:hypothetical protein